MKSPLKSSLSTSPEWQLTLACARTRLDNVQRDRILKLLSGRLDWARFTEIVTRHRVESLVASHLATEFAAFAPAGALARLKEEVHARAYWNLRLTGQMISILDLFEQAGVFAVPYKGPTLGALAYSNFALRNFQDLDFAIPQREIPRALALLRDAGLVAAVSAATVHHARHLERGSLGQYLFHGDAGEIMIELHTEKTLRYFPLPLEWDGLRERLVPVSVSGRTLHTFSAEDLLILLSVHGAKHFWSRLNWVCDIAELAQIQSIDWGLSERLASQMHCRRMWLLGLSLAHQILDAPLPDEVIRWIEKDSGVADLRRRTQISLISGSEKVVGLPQRLQFRIRSHQTAREGLLQSIRMATRLTEDDWSGFELPEWAEPLYFALRPWRLLYKHGVARHK